MGPQKHEKRPLPPEGTGGGASDAISDETLELAVHRSLRAEIPPCVRGILATTVSPELVELQVFHYGAVSQLAACPATPGASRAIRSAQRT